MVVERNRGYFMFGGYEHGVQHDDYGWWYSIIEMEVRYPHTHFIPEKIRILDSFAGQGHHMGMWVEQIDNCGIGHMGTTCGGEWTHS